MGKITGAFSATINAFNNGKGIIQKIIGKMQGRKAEALDGDIVAAKKKTFQNTKEAIGQKAKTPWKAKHKVKIGTRDAKAVGGGKNKPGPKIGEEKKPRMRSYLGVEGSKITDKRGVATPARIERVNKFNEYFFNILVNETKGGGAEKNTRAYQKAFAFQDQASENDMVALRFEEYNELSNENLLSIVKDGKESTFCRMHAEDVLLDRGIELERIIGSAYEAEEGSVEGESPKAEQFQKGVTPEGAGNTARGRLAEQREGIEVGGDEIQVSKEQVAAGEKRQARMADLTRLVILGNRMGSEEKNAQLGILDQKIAAVDEAFEKQPELKNDPAQQKLFQSLHKERSDLRQVSSAPEGLRKLIGSDQMSARKLYGDLSNEQSSIMDKMIEGKATEADQARLQEVNNEIGVLGAAFKAVLGHDISPLPKF